MPRLMPNVLSSKVESRRRAPPHRELDVVLDEFELSHGELSAEEVVLDLRDVRQIRSAELSRLIELRLTLQSQSRRLVLANVEREVREVLAITRLDHVMEVRLSASEGVTVENQRSRPRAMDRGQPASGQGESPPRRLFAWFSTASAR